MFPTSQLGLYSSLLGTQGGARLGLGCLRSTIPYTRTPGLTLYIAGSRRFTDILSGTIMIFRLRILSRSRTWSIKKVLTTNFLVCNREYMNLSFWLAGRYGCYCPGPCSAPSLPVAPSRSPSSCARLFRWTLATVPCLHTHTLRL